MTCLNIQQFKTSDGHLITPVVMISVDFFFRNARKLTQHVTVFTVAIFAAAAGSDPLQHYRAEIKKKKVELAWSGQRLVSGGL